MVYAKKCMWALVLYLYGIRFGGPSTDVQMSVWSMQCSRLEMSAPRILAVTVLSLVWEVSLDLVATLQLQLLCKLFLLLAAGRRHFMYPTQMHCGTCSG